MQKIGWILYTDEMPPTIAEFEEELNLTLQKVNVCKYPPIWRMEILSEDGLLLFENPPIGRLYGGL